MKKGCLSFFLGIIFVLVIIVVGIFILINTSKQVGVRSSDADFNTGLEKIKTNISDITVINAGNLITHDFSTKGTNRVDFSLSDAEVTSLASKANNAPSPIKDVQLKFLGDNQMEMSYKISENAINFLKKSNIFGSAYKPGFPNTAMSNPFLSSSVSDTVIKYLTTVAVNKPIYSKGKLERTSPNTIDINIETIQVGRVPLPASTVKTIESYTVSFINALISKDNGFSIDELRIEDGQLYYKGTLPAEITGKKLD